MRYIINKSFNNPRTSETYDICIVDTFDELADAKEHCESIVKDLGQYESLEIYDRFTDEPEPLASYSVESVSTYSGVSVSWRGYPSEAVNAEIARRNWVEGKDYDRRALDAFLREQSRSSRVTLEDAMDKFEALLPL